MVRQLIQDCGPFFFIIQLLFSLLTVGCVCAYGVAMLRRELPRGEKPWDPTVQPLCGIAVLIGLLGSVVSFRTAFGGVNENGVDVAQISAGLTRAYTTTAWGLIAAVFGAIGCWVLGRIVKKNANSTAKS